MGILFVVAEMQEAKHIIEHYKMKKVFNLECINLWFDKSNKNQLIVTGPGVINTIISLSKATELGILSKHSNVFNVGYAGAKGIDVGEVVEVKSCHCFEFPTKANIGIQNHVNISNKGVPCFTSFDFVEKADSVDTAVFDMELAYIVSFPHNVVRSMKIVSDNLSYESYKQFDSKKAWEEVIRKIEERR